MSTKVTILLTARRLRDVEVMKSALPPKNLISSKVWNQEFEALAYQPSIAMEENQNQQ